MVHPQPDFSPLVNDSKEYNAAVNARREMLNHISKADNTYTAPKLNGAPAPRFRWPVIGDLELGKWASQH